MFQNRKEAVITLSVLAVLVAGTAAYYLWPKQEVDTERPPELVLNIPKLQGALTDNVGICNVPGMYPGPFSEAKIPAGTDRTDLRELQANTHMYYVASDLYPATDDGIDQEGMSVQDIIDAIDATDGEKVLLAFYSAQKGEIGAEGYKDEGWYLFPDIVKESDPANYHGISEPETMFIPPYEGFVIFTCKGSSIYNVNGETDIPDGITTHLNEIDEGWVLLPDFFSYFEEYIDVDEATESAEEANADEFENIMEEKLKSIWLQGGRGFDFPLSLSYIDIDTAAEKYSDAETTPEHHMIWVKLGEPTAPEVEDEGADTSELDTSYSIYPTTNLEQDITSSLFSTEAPGLIKAVERDNVIVLVPDGYEELAKVNVEDLIGCRKKLSNFFGVSFPAEKVKLKIFVSTDDTNKGFSLGNMLFYQRSQENIDMDLQDVLNDNPSGFTYKSSSTYCANTHELTHAFFSGAPFPSWANEGTAEFAQEINQPGSKDDTTCDTHGFYTGDIWGDGEYKFFAFSDLSTLSGAEFGDGAKWYRSANCLVKELNTTYGDIQFKEIFKKLRRYQSDPSLLDIEASYMSEACRQNPLYGAAECIFIKNILEEALGDSVYPILEKYGFNTEDYSN